jgi:hypothetical protein
MAIDPGVRRTRRALLAGVVGSVVASVVTAIDRPSLVRAGTDGDVVLGADNTSSVTTKVRNPTTVSTALTGAGASAIGVEGTSLTNIGVRGRSTSGPGVNGTSDSGVGITADGGAAGVLASSTSGTAVEALSSGGTAVRAFTAEGKAAVFATNENRDTAYPAIAGVTWFGGPAVMGIYSDDVSAPIVGATGPPRTGVYGVTSGADDAPPSHGTTGVWGEASGGRGVYGHSYSGRGVVGEAMAPTGTTYGVYGTVVSPDGRAVNGYAPDGTGVRGSTSGGTGGAFYASTGYAIKASGRVKFDRSSGIAVINAGQRSVKVAPGFDLGATSIVFLTPRADIGSRRLWYSVDPVANSFTIMASTAVGASISVGWLIVG